MGGHLTLQYILDNQPALYAELCRRQAVVRDYVRGVAYGYSTGFYLYGLAGTAKSYIVQGVLDREIKEPYVYQSGHLTPLGLFKLLAEHADEILVLDDLGSIFRSEVALQILLSALVHPTAKDRSRIVKYLAQRRQQWVAFRGGIICISNKVLHDTELLGAFKSRVNTMNYNPSDGQLGALMLEIARHGWPSLQPTILPQDCEIIACFLIEEMLRLRVRFDLRLLVDKAFPAYQQWKDNETECHWQDLVTSFIEEQLVELQHSVEAPSIRAERKAQEHEILKQILREHRSRRECQEAWSKQTGKSARAFYRRLAEIDNT